MNSFKLFEYVDQAKKFLKQNNISEDDFLYKEIRNLLKGHDGYVGWFTKIAYNDVLYNGKDKATILISLNNILKNILNEKYLINLFQKPLFKIESIEEFIDEYEQAKLKYKAKKIYDEFPSEQKQLINLNDSEEISLLSKLYDDNGKNIFLKKISVYKTKSILLSSIENFLNKADIKTNEKFKTILNKLKQKNIEIIYAKNNLIIVKINNFTECQEIGSRTSWCIVRDSSMFKSYVNDLSKQYAIYFTELPDTNNNSLIGVTFNVDGFWTAHNIIDNYVNYNTLYQWLDERGFDIDKLKIKKEDITYDKFNIIEVNSLIDIGFSKDEIVKHKTTIHMNDLVNFTKDELIKYNLISKLNDENVRVSFFKQLNFNNDEIVKYKKYFLGDDLSFFTKSEIYKYNLKNRTYLSGVDIPNMTKSYIIEKFDRFKNYTIKNEDLLNKGFKYYDFLKLKDIKIKLIDYKFYDEYLSFTKDDVLKNSYKIKSSDLKKTIELFNFYDINKDDFELDDYEYFFNINNKYSLIEDINLIKKYFNDINYRNINSDEFIKFLYKCAKLQSLSNENKIEFFITLINLNYNCYDDLVNNINKMKEPLSEYSNIKEKLKEILDKNNEYKKLKNELILHLDTNDFVKKTGESAGYYWGKSGNALNYEKWYIKYGDFAKTVDWNIIVDEYNNGYRYGKEYLISYLLLLTILGKLEDAKNLNFNKWEISMNFGFGSELSILGKIALNITNSDTTNTNPTYLIQNELTDEHRKKLYDWLNTYVINKITDKDMVDYNMQSVYYLYDKNKFNEYFQKIKLVKNNEWEYNDKDKKVFYTNRFKKLYITFKYLIYYNKYFELKELIKKFISFKLLKNEIKSLIYFINNNIKDTHIFKKEILNIIPIKENILTEYNLFLIKKII
jgi:hypothetical protein